MTREAETPMVTLKTVDRLIGLLVVGLTLIGSYSWWRAIQRARGRSGMMGQMMGTMPGMDPIWYLFGTLTAVSVIVGVYVMCREQLAHILSTTDGAPTADRNHQNTSTDPHDPSANHTFEEANQNPSTNALTSKGPSALTFLPDDEQRVLEPILDSPGLTQVELRGRSGFSKAKVSQTVSELEKRGLIYRERQGRTYRIYPGELVKDQRQS